MTGVELVDCIRKTYRAPLRDKTKAGHERCLDDALTAIRNLGESIMLRETSQIHEQGGIRLAATTQYAEHRLVSTPTHNGNLVEQMPMFFYRIRVENTGPKDAVYVLSYRSITYNGEVAHLSKPPSALGGPPGLVSGDAFEYQAQRPTAGGILHAMCVFTPVQRMGDELQGQGQGQGRDQEDKSQKKKKHEQQQLENDQIVMNLSLPFNMPWSKSKP
ncbi:unnamed protein product [Chrysoparadoxa australica]